MQLQYKGMQDMEKRKKTLKAAPTQARTHPIYM